MAATFPEFLSQVKNIIGVLSPAKRVALLAIAGGIALGFYFLLTWAGKPEFTYLARNLSPEDAGAVLAKLKEKKVEYQIDDNGSSILVPSVHVHELRMDLAAQGLPRGGGVGFEIFDTTKLGMTEFVQNINYQRALQGELSRTINSFDKVMDSRVHIVMSSKSLFAEQEEPASASVVLKLRYGSWLKKGEIEGIVNLVSSSVSGLHPENVAVIDNTGKIFTAKEKTIAESINSNQLEFQEKVEKNLENRVKTMLDTALGAGQSVVRISCDIDFKKHEKTEEIYFPDNQIARSEQISNLVSFDPDIAPSGIPGVASNITPSKTGTPGTKENIKMEKKDTIVNYEIGKTISHIIEPLGTIKRLSVAVIVDGTYEIVQPPVKAEIAETVKTVKKDEKKAKGEEKDAKEESAVQREYLPRTEDEMQKLEAIVKSAINFNEERGDRFDIINMPFKTTKIFEPEEVPVGIVDKIMEFKPFFKHIITIGILLFSFLFIVRPLLKWLTSDSLGEVQLISQLPKAVDELEREYANGIKSLPSKSSALNAIAANKEESAKLMQDWLKD